MWRFLWAALALLTALEAGSAALTEVVARDIRKLGDGSCEASVAVRYSEAYAPMAQSPRLLRNARETVPCSDAPEAADRLTRHLESELLLQAQDWVNHDNARVRTFTLVGGTPLRTEATFQASVLRRLKQSTQVPARSVTPNWYAVTDAAGHPTEGYFHFSAIIAEVGEPLPVLGMVAAACNARLRAAPNDQARVIKNLRCGQPLNVTVVGRGGWYQLVSAEGLPQNRYISSKALKPLAQKQSPAGNKRQKAERAG